MKKLHAFKLEYLSATHGWCIEWFSTKAEANAALKEAKRDEGVEALEGITPHSVSNQRDLISLLTHHTPNRNNG